MYYYGSRVAALDAELRQYEKANSDKLRRLTKYQLRLPNRPEVMSHYDVLIAELYEARGEYRTHTHTLAPWIQLEFCELTLRRKQIR